MTVLAIDPGYVESGFVLYDGKVVEAGIEKNEDLLAHCYISSASHICIEQIESQGMAVGKETFETVFWSGRFFEAFGLIDGRHRLTRRAIKLHLCGSSKATDANIRMALIDRFGGSSAVEHGKKCRKIKSKNHGVSCPVCGGYGWENPPGPLAGISGHLWAALAVGVTFLDQLKQP